MSCTRPEEFSKARNARYAKFCVSEKKIMNTKFTHAVLGPLGKEKFGDDEKYTNEFMFASCPDIPDEEKVALYLKWAERWKNGEFDPEPKFKKKVAARGNALDDIPPEKGVGAGDIVEARDVADEEEPEIVEAKEEEEDDEIEARAIEARAERQSEDDSVPITPETKPKPKKVKEKPKPKSKKELLLELLEEESGGLTEEDVERIAMRVCLKILTNVTEHVSEDHLFALRNYEKNNELS